MATVGAQRWLPTLAAAVVVIGALVLWRALATREHAQVERIVQLKAQVVTDAIANGVDARVLALVRMVNRWEVRGRPAATEWQQDAGLYVQHYAGYQSLAWLDRSLHTRWLVSPEAKQAGGRPGPVSEQLKPALAAARDRRQAVISGAVGLGKTDSGFSVVLPLFPQGDFDGFVLATFNGREVLSSILRGGQDYDGYDVAVRDGAHDIYRSKGYDESTVGAVERATSLALHGATWRIVVRPTQAYLATMYTQLPQVTLATGFVLAGLLAMALYFAQTERIKEQELDTVNRKLKDEIAIRRRAEDEVARHAAELERSNAELSQFAYVASHDLQEPLRIVSGYVQLLAKRYRGRLDADADEFIGYTVDGAARMQLLISDLLAYSRVGSRIKPFAPVACDTVVARATASLRIAIAESGAHVTHDPLPTVMGDDSQLEQLFMNLIGNAIKYRSATPPRVHVAAERSDGEWRFAVRDNGIGIDPKYADRIFVIFQRLHGQGEYSGTGIGLAICKKVVENHGGRVWVESRPGEGATFYFTIPAA